MWRQQCAIGTTQSDAAAVAASIASLHSERWSRWRLRLYFCLLSARASGLELGTSDDGDDEAKTEKSN